jgi:protein involved in polysaccharide export with SLBB domain
MNSLPVPPVKLLFSLLCPAIFMAGVCRAQMSPPVTSESAASAPAPVAAPPARAPLGGSAASATTAAAPSGPLASAVSAPTGYQLNPNDSIGVEVFGEDDLKTVSRLNGEGNVSLPLIGPVHLGGLTLTQATTRVTELYGKDYLVSPRVNVVLVGYAKRRFTVLGQVSRPGSYEMPESSPGGIDLLEAIAMAGGYTRIAAPERISVRRRSGGRDEVLRVNAKRLERGDARVGSFQVMPGDTITVAESIF